MPETTNQETLAILKGLRATTSKFHGVVIGDEVLEDAVYFASRYINDRYMPDKAIDMLDEAAALLRGPKRLPGEYRRLIKRNSLIKRSP